MASDQRCGNCKHYDGFGGCIHPTTYTVVPSAMTVWPMSADEGADCPTFEPKEPGND